MAVPGFPCCWGFFSGFREQGLLSSDSVWASLAVERRLQERRLQRLQRVGPVVEVPRLWSTGSVVTAHGPSCFAAGGLLLDQGWNLHPPH